MSNRARRRFLILGLLLGSVGCGGDPTARLTEQLKDPDANVRRSAARAIVQQRKPDERFIALLSKSASDEDVEVRRLSVLALGQFGKAAASSIPVLRKTLSDPEPSVRLKAALSLQHVDPKDNSYVAVLTVAMHTGDGRTLLEIGAMGKDAAWAVPTLIELLLHESPKVRALAAQTLGRIGPPAIGAKEALQRTAHDPNAAVQTTSREALEKIQGQAIASGH